MRIYKYQAFQDYLTNSNQEKIELTFAEIEQICGCKLLQSAYNYDECWSNGGHNSFSKSWYHAGYCVKADRQKEIAVFTKDSGAVPTTRKVKARKSREYACTLDVQTAVSAISEYYSTTKTGEHTRYLSWEHCRRAFSENWADPSKTKYLCLHLAWYLASWGMLRNSFLFQNDYLIHKNVVQKLCSKPYNQLFKESTPNIELIMQATEIVRNGYGKYKVTDTLVTKILLGIFGCVPAYDRYFKDGIQRNGLAGTFDANTLQCLWNYYLENKTYIDSACTEIGIPLDLYTPMKLMDMCFWQIGYNIDKKD